MRAQPIGNAVAHGVLVALPLGFLGFGLIVPAMYLGGQGWGQIDAATLQSMAQDSYLQWRLVWSLLQAVVSCAVVLALGVPVGWVLARYDFAGRSSVLRALMLPFVMPTLLAALGVLALLGPRGLALQWCGIDAQGTPWLLLYGNVFFNLCVVVRASMDGFAQLSSAQIAAARSLGASPWRVFLRLEWPIALPWVLSSASLVGLYCFSGFGLALMLGGQQFSTVEVEIYTLVAHELKLGQASVLALLSMTLGGLAAWAYSQQARCTSTARPQDCVSRVRVQTAAQKTALVCALAVLVVCCAAPLLAIGWRAIHAQAWDVFVEIETWLAVWNTLRFSTMALVLAGIFGVLHALAAQRNAWMRLAMWLPFVVSPVTIAFGMLLAYPSAAASLPLLIGAYALLAYPFVAVAVMNALDALPLDIQHVASMLGASPWRVFWRITWPLIQPALRRGLAFSAASCVGEFAISLFLSRPEWTTLTTLIYQMLGRPGISNLDSAWVLACVLMVLSMAAFRLLDVPQPIHTLNAHA